MKRYYNKTTGEWYYEGRTMTHSTESMLFSGVPTAEQLSEWGFDEWVEPEPPELTEEELLEKAKVEKIEALVEYDSSSAINEFTYNGVSMWLDKATRAGLQLRITAEQAVGDTTTTLWFDTQSFTIPIGNAMQLLYAIEIYASQCYDKTAEHKAAIQLLSTLEEVESYDFTVGYPAKLNF